MPGPHVAKGQFAVLWARSGFNAGGQPKVLAGRQINCTWRSGSRETLEGDDTVVGQTATVTVNESIPIHSIMRLGKLTQVPSTPDELYEVISQDESPDLKARDVARTVSLTRWKKPLPTIVS